MFEFKQRLAMFVTLIACVSYGSASKHNKPQGSMRSLSSNNDNMSELRLLSEDPERYNMYDPYLIKTAFDTHPTTTQIQQTQGHGHHQYYTTKPSPQSQQPNTIQNPFIASIDHSNNNNDNTMLRDMMDTEMIQECNDYLDTSDFDYFICQITSHVRQLYPNDEMPGHPYNILELCASMTYIDDELKNYPCAGVPAMKSLSDFQYARIVYTPYNRTYPAVVAYAHIPQDDLDIVFYNSSWYVMHK